MSGDGEWVCLVRGKVGVSGEGRNVFLLRGVGVSGVRSAP